MKKYARLFKYLAAYKANIALYFLFIILAIVFSVASIGSLPFFIDLIFTKGKADVIKPETIGNSQDFIRYISYYLQELIKTNGAAPVPSHLRDSHYPGSAQIGHGADYLYPHDFPGNYVKQDYVMQGSIPEKLYQPGENEFEMGRWNKLALQIKETNL